MTTTASWLALSALIVAADQLAKHAAVDDGGAQHSGGGARRRGDPAGALLRVVQQRRGQAVPFPSRVDTTFDV